MAPLFWSDPSPNVLTRLYVFTLVFSTAQPAVNGYVSIYDKFTTIAYLHVHIAYIVNIYNYLIPRIRTPFFWDKQRQSTLNHWNCTSKRSRPRMRGWHRQPTTKNTKYKYNNNFLKNRESVLAMWMSTSIKLPNVLKWLLVRKLSLLENAWKLLLLLQSA